MSALARLRALLSRGGAASPAGTIRVRVLLKGRTGAGWVDVDETLTLPAGATLGALIDAAERRGIRLREALETSPHLAHTLMLNGERRPVEQHRQHVLADGDEVYLLAPLAGGL
jgi:molybdopterin converting factor small subunit